MRAFRSGPEAEEKRDGRRSRGEQPKACVTDAERIAGFQAIKKAEHELCFFRTRRNWSSSKPKELIMIFDPQIVAQAKAFVNALKSGRRAHVPALRFEYWQQFMTTVNAEMGYI